MQRKHIWANDGSRPDQYSAIRSLFFNAFTFSLSESWAARLITWHIGKSRAPVVLTALSKGSIRLPSSGPILLRCWGVCICRTVGCSRREVWLHHISIWILISEFCALYSVTHCSWLPAPTTMLQCHVYKERQHAGNENSQCEDAIEFIASSIWSNMHTMSNKLYFCGLGKGKICISSYRSWFDVLHLSVFFTQVCQYWAAPEEQRRARCRSSIPSYACSSRYRKQVEEWELVYNMHWLETHGHHKLIHFITSYLIFNSIMSKKEKAILLSTWHCQADKCHTHLKRVTTNLVCVRRCKSHLFRIKTHVATEF